MGSRPPARQLVHPLLGALCFGHVSAADAGQDVRTGTAFTMATAGTLHRDGIFSATMSGPTYAQPLYVASPPMAPTCTSPPATPSEAVTWSGGEAIP